ncbi:reverse transcriptase domain-containing protein [Tanacetum coccineum]
MIMNEGIQANPKKVQAIINMASPRTLCEVQALNGKLAALGHFLAKSAERLLTFFKTLKGCLNKKDFKWNTEAEVAFQELKEHLQSLPALTIPMPGETLTLYLAAPNEAISHEQANYVPREAHFGSCRAHAGSRSITQKAARLGVIISDNGKQFAINPFREWCEELKIKQDYTSVAHPQANGQTEVTNRTILQGLKTRLGKAKGQWVKRITNVIWAISNKRSTK